jgi:hypothetical protein
MSSVLTIRPARAGPRFSPQWGHDTQTPLQVAISELSESLKCPAAPIRAPLDELDVEGAAGRCPECRQHLIQPAVASQLLCDSVDGPPDVLAPEGPGPRRPALGEGRANHSPRPGCRGDLSRQRVFGCRVSTDPHGVSTVERAAGAEGLPCEPTVVAQSPSGLEPLRSEPRVVSARPCSVGLHHIRSGYLIEKIGRASCRERVFNIV